MRGCIPRASKLLALRLKREIAVSDPITLLEAVGGDIPLLVDHRRRMFEDWAEAEGKHFAPADLDTMAKDYAAHLQAHLGDGLVWGWIAQLGEEVVGSGVVSILAYPPVPGSPPEHTALLHSMYTVPQYRRRGVARQITEAAIASCRENGCNRIVLGGKGTEAGRPLYESVGFKLSESSQLML